MKKTTNKINHIHLFFFKNIKQEIYQGEKIIVLKSILSEVTIN